MPVVQYDDNSMPGMHDLEVRPTDEPAHAAEVTAAADQDAIELWNLVNGGEERLIEPGLVGGWFVTLKPTARASALRAGLRALLVELEQEQVAEASHRDRRSPYCSSLAELGIVRARQGPTAYPGSVYFTISLPAERAGAFVPDHSNAVAGWVGEFVAGERLAGKRTKLGRSGADRRHLFLLLPGFTTAPFLVTYALMRDSPPLPTEAPQLPVEVTDVWLASGWGQGVGLWWSPCDGWRTFDKLQH